MEQVTITNIPEISAIYFALLQCGYEYFSLDRASEHISHIRSFLSPELDFHFFSQVGQAACEVYPYWPRAALLETASFFTLPSQDCFSRFSQLEQIIMSATNISDEERGENFWNWLRDFPSSLHRVMEHPDFKAYFKWECGWIRKQNAAYYHDLQDIQNLLNICANLYSPSEIHNISIVINPIKCVYSSDYHLINGRFVFTSGRFQKDSVIHEFLHHIAHSIVEFHRAEILQKNPHCPGIDSSYYLCGDDDGKINAFEEYFVRTLTDAILFKSPPADLHSFLLETIQ